jgi:rubrerythrin
MSLNIDQKELLEAFIEQEYLISILYKLFAKKYPAYKAFWTKMAKEELDHASIIKRITEGVSSDQIKFSHGELRANSLASSMNYVNGLISDCRSDKDVPIAQAVSIALTLEKALWEQQVFKYFEGDSAEVRNFLDTLSVEQRNHIRKIEMFATQFKK